MNSASEKTRSNPGRSDPAAGARIWAPARGEILHSDGGCMMVRVREKLDARRVYEFKTSGADRRAFTGLVQGSCLDGLPIRGGEIEPLFRSTVMILR